MALLRPVATYALAAVLVLWVLLGAITLPNANRWFRGSGYSIQEDVISFPLNNTKSMNDALPEKYGDREFKSNVYPIDKTPDVPNNSLQGVLYDRGESCTSKDPKVIPIPNFVQQHTNISKIALIRQSTNCFLTDEILNAQLDGASGVIIFHNLFVSEDPSAKYDGMGVMPKTVKIPAYYMDLNAGLMLLKDLKDLYKTNGSKREGLSSMMIRVTLSPSSKPMLDHWQFALVIVGIMLVTSIIAISALQCHMWRMAQNCAANNNINSENETLTIDEQRQLTMDENFWRGIIGQPLRPLVSQIQRRKQRLDQALVNLLPTRIYEEKKEVEDIKEDGVSEKQGSRNVSVDLFGTTCELSSCVICLDAFASGEVLRRLPCNHEYHRDCIDVWLTKKSASCPLCQQTIQIPTVPDEIHAAAEESRMYYEGMPDLAETWTGMVQNEQIAMRQASWVAQRQQQQENHHQPQQPFNPYPPM